MNITIILNAPYSSTYTNKKEWRPINIPLSSIKQIMPDFSYSSKVYVDFRNEHTKSETNAYYLEVVGETQFLIQRLKMIDLLDSYPQSNHELKKLQDILLNPDCFRDEIKQYESVFFSKKEVDVIMEYTDNLKERVDVVKLQSIIEKLEFEQSLHQDLTAHNKSKTNKI